MPKMKRREAGLPAEAQNPAGVMIKRNPGVTLVWVTLKYQAFLTSGKPFPGPYIPEDDGVLFQVGEPTETMWFAEGRPATREQVENSVESGLPLLENAARQDGPEAQKQLAQMVLDAEKYYPKKSLIIMPGE
jgi:hypothetical protein